MQQECHECVRLWDAYVAARSAYATLKREVDSARAGGNSAAANALVAKAKAAFEHKEQSRAALDEHETQSHR